MGLGKKQAICHGRVPACMLSHSLSLGSLALLSCGVEHLCACVCVCVCVFVCVCKRKVSSPLMIHSPEEAALMGGKN